MRGGEHKDISNMWIKYLDILLFNKHTTDALKIHIRMYFERRVEKQYKKNYKKEVEKEKSTQKLFLLASQHFVTNISQKNPIIVIITHLHQ